jgi:hypothetical protein
MALSLVFAGVALFLAEMGAGHERAARFLGNGRIPRRAVRKVCAGCERQRALFRYHGVVKWDRYHTLCRRCFRAPGGRSVVRRAWCKVLSAVPRARVLVRTQQSPAPSKRT